MVSSKAQVRRFSRRHPKRLREQPCGGEIREAVFSALFRHDLAVPERP